MSELPPVTTPTGRLLAHLRGVKGNGRKFVALCPAHEDANPSLSVTVGTDGRCVVHCHAGCSTESVVAAVGLTLSDLFADATRPREAPASPAPPTRARLVKTYDYTDEHGALLYQVCRFEPKTFRQRRKDANGDWLWEIGDARPVLYNLPRVIEAVALGHDVFVVEGEKDCDTLAECGIVATTNAGGAKKWRDEFADVLRGASVVILPDNDDVGKQHAEQIAASCADRGCAVKVVALPNLPPKGDVTDWLNDGHDGDELNEIVAQTGPWAMDPAKRTRWRLDELWANREIMRPPHAVVPRLAWVGRSTLLVAREKLGKSTLTGYVSARVTQGGTFLGDPCERSVVLVVGLEEFIGDCARRLREFDADPTRIHIVDRFAGDPQLRPQELADHIAAVQPRLVIVDSLAAYSRGQIQDDNNATQMTAVLQPLTDLAHQREIALVIVHHARKSDGRSRGSTAITAATDVVCEFLAPDEDADPTLRRMRIAGRVPVAGFDFRFDGREYRIDTGEKAPLATRILDLIRNRPAGCNASDVADLLGARKSDVLTEITHMLADGRLRDLAGSAGRARKLVVPEELGGVLFPSRDAAA